MVLRKVRAVLGKNKQVKSMVRHIFYHYLETVGVLVSNPTTR